MFVPVWLFFLGSGTLMAVLTLVWAMRTHQLEDQDRARYLPLWGLTRAELERGPSPGRRAAKLGLLAVVLSGALVLGLTLAVVLRHV